MKKYSSILYVLVPLIIALGFMVESLKMPVYGEFYQSPGFFPFVIASLFAITSLILLMQEASKLKKEAAITTSEGNEEKTEASIKEPLARALYIVLFIIIYGLMIWFRISFMISTAVFLIATLFFYERKRIVSNLFFTAICSFGLYYVFTKLFYIPLP